jgi:serine phosphatase RsbU (regulator of sigma subunit)
MGHEQIKSPAFQNAELQSECIRIFGVLGFICIFVLVIAVRVFVIHTAASAPWTFLVAVVVIAYELWMLREVGLALKGNHGLGPEFWILSTILETSTPAFVIAFLSNPQLEAAYRPLASPAVLVFFIFIILSTLRLNPGVSALCGAVAAITYISAALYLGWRPPVPGMPAPITQSSVTLYAVTLLVGGLIAAAVAGQIRKHVQSALREAETKQKLEAIQHDLSVARSIQQSLLPQQTPGIKGFDIAGWNQPADDTGGDYFDWIRLPEGKVIVTLADVTGHGIGPALLASVCRAYARSNFSVAQDLPNAFEHINSELAADLGTGRFVTFVAATLCPGCVEVEMLSAGHGPLLFYSRPEDRFSAMNAHALPLGMFPFFKSDPPAHLQLHPGDLLVLATDGFFEWENDQGEEFGVDRMERVMRASRDSAASEIITHLYDAVIRFSNGTRQQDDLTAVVIKGV